jgi:hypothetical protein
MAKAFIQTLGFGKRRRRILLLVRQNQSPPNNKIRIRNHQPLRMMLQVRETERERERIHMMVAPTFEVFCSKFSERTKDCFELH